MGGKTHRYLSDQTEGDAVAIFDLLELFYRNGIRVDISFRGSVDESKRALADQWAKLVLFPHILGVRIALLALCWPLHAGWVQIYAWTFVRVVI